MNYSSIDIAVRCMVLFEKEVVGSIWACRGKTNGSCFAKDFGRSRITPYYYDTNVIHFIPYVLPLMIIISKKMTMTKRVLSSSTIHH